eukprot:TRINITY_DN57598_c0_g1_i1.p1 TRINITY_DN57598_c0_g1~~TRINITY_DN57598_c0_g1_i1.p1  ORF type:complete len:878 (+),score=56.84 TRINITY_DN57598_c0_g1_i1:50-2683(+)
MTGVVLHDKWQTTEDTLFSLQTKDFSGIFLEQLAQWSANASDLLGKILSKLSNPSRTENDTQQMLAGRRAVLTDIHTKLELTTPIDQLFVHGTDSHLHMLGLLVTRLENIKKRMNNETHFDSYLNSVVETGIVKVDQLRTEVMNAGGDPKAFVGLAVPIIEQLEHSWNFTNVKELHEKIDEHIYDHMHEAHVLDHCNDGVVDPAKITSDRDIVIGKLKVYQKCMDEVVEKTRMIGRAENEFKPRPGQTARARIHATNSLKHHVGSQRVLLAHVKDDLHALELHKRKFSIQSATQRNVFSDAHLTRQKLLQSNTEKQEAARHELEVLQIRLQKLAEERKVVVAEIVKGAQEEATRVEGYQRYLSNVNDYEEALTSTMKRTNAMIDASAHLQDFIEDVCQSLEHYYAKAKEKLTQLMEIVHMEQLRYFRKLYKHLTPQMHTVMTEMEACKKKIASADEIIQEAGIDELRQLTHVEVLGKRDAAKRYSHCYEELTGLRKLRDQALATFKPSADALKAAGYLFASPDATAPVHLMSMHRALASLVDKLQEDSDSDSDDNEEAEVLQALLQGDDHSPPPALAHRESIGIPLPMSPHQMKKFGKPNPNAGGLHLDSQLESPSAGYTETKPSVPVPTRDGEPLQMQPEPLPRRSLKPRLLYGPDTNVQSDDEEEPAAPPKPRQKILWSAFAAAASLGTAPTERMSGWHIGHAREKRLQRRALVMQGVGMDNLEAMEYDKQLDQALKQKRQDRHVKLKKERDYRLLQSLRQEIHEQELAQWDHIIELLTERTYPERKLLMFSKLHKKEVFLHGDDQNNYNQVKKSPKKLTPRPPPQLPPPGISGRDSSVVESLQTPSLQERHPSIRSTRSTSTNATTTTRTSQRL